MKKLAGPRKPRQPVETKALVSLPYLHNDADALRTRGILYPAKEQA
jgi:hypothetical protein